MRVKELRQYLKANKKNLIPDVANLDFMPVYKENASVFDMKLHDFETLPLFDVEGETMDAQAFEDVQDHIKMMLIMNTYKYNKLFETMSFEYNPMYNTEWEEVHINGQQKTTDSIGLRKETQVHGSQDELDTISHGLQRETNIYGKRETTDTTGIQTNKDITGQQVNSDNIGQQTNTDTAGKRTETDAEHIDTTTHEANGYDSPATTPNGKDIMNAGQQQRISDSYTDSHVVGSHDDSHTIGSREDSHTIGSREDKHIESAVEDSKIFAEYEDKNRRVSQAYSDINTNNATEDSHTSESYEDRITKAGNIGVMSSQELVEAQRKVVRWSFWEHLYNDIVNEICLKVW